MSEYDANQAAQDALDARRVSRVGRVSFYIGRRAEKTMTAKLFLLLPYVFFVAVFAVAWLAIGFLLDWPRP